MRTKILIISHNCFSSTHNNGKTLSAIFSAFRPEELCQLFFTAIGNPDYDRCSDFFFISDQNALKSIVRRKQCGQALPKKPEATMGLDPNDRTSVSCRSRRITKIRKFVRSVIWLLSAWYKGGLNIWLERQRPNAIFYVGGDSFFSHYIALGLSKKLAVPLITYFTDDYVINPPTDLYNWMLKKVYRKTVSRSSQLFAIGSQMADDYTDYFGRPFKPIMNIVSIPDKEDWREIVNNEQITINYFGGLHLGRLKEIIRFAIFFEERVKNLISKDYSISIYSFATPSLEERKELDRHGVVLNQGLTGHELEEKMKNSSVLLHVESIEKNYHALTKLSVSTKIPEYMCMSKPILAFGPADVASFRVISEANPSLVIDDVENEGVMREQSIRIAEILNSNNLMKRISSDNFEYAKSHFDKGVVSSLFRRDVEAVIG